MTTRPDNLARPRDETLPRSFSGGLALPPRQVPLPATPNVGLSSTAGTRTSIVAGVTDRVVGAVAAIRRTAAELGIS